MGAEYTYQSEFAFEERLILFEPRQYIEGHFGCLTPP